MKSIYSTLCLAAISTTLTAQRVQTAPASALLETAKHVTEVNDLGIAKAAAGDTVLYEDFTNGLAGNTSFGAWTTTGPNAAVWAYDTDGPNGDFSATSERIQSTTFANGFMIFDSNLFNDGCTTNGSCVDLDGYLVSPVLDLSATPNVRLQFEERFRWCCSATSPHFVDVSTDGGSTWTTRFEVANNVDVNTNVVTNLDIGTHLRWFNIASAISADPSNVRIRIAHEGSATTSGSHYHWQIDDLSIVESPNNDVRVSIADYDNYDSGLTDNLEYFVYPYSQVREFTMRTRMHNEGQNPANNVMLEVDVNDGTSSIFNSTGTVAVMAPSVEDSIEITGFTPPMVTGDYTVSFTVTSDSTDSDPTDNVATKNFQVDEFMYALDDGARDDEDDNQDNDYLLGNVFYIENATDLTGIEVAVASGVGALIRGVLLDDQLTPIAETQEKTITASNITPNGGANFVRLAFDVPVPLTAGTEYVAVMEHFGGLPNVEVAVSGRSYPQTSFIYNAYAASGPDWFYTTSTPMVRMTFDPTVGVEELGDEAGILSVAPNYPNPAADATTIVYTLEEAASVSLEVTDLSGKLIDQVQAGRMGPGANQLELNTSEIAEGTYFYTLTANDVRVTQKFTVAR